MGDFLIRTVSEKEGTGGITLQREFKVHDLGADPEVPGNHKVEIREDVMKPPEMSENVTTVSIARS